MSTLMPKLKSIGAAALVLAVVVATSLSAQAQTSAPAKPLAKVSFRLDWKPGGQHAAFYLAKERGYFAAEGLDVTIIVGSGSSDSVKLLGTGTVNLALVDSLVLVQAAEQRVPIKAVAGYYQRTPIALISPKAKPITDPKQLLSGAKIGSKRASSTSQALTALMAANNIDAKKVNIVDIGFGVQPLLVGQVDALMGFTMNESIEAESAGMAVQELMVADFGVNAYGLMLASNDKFIQSNPELIKAFLRATSRAKKATLTDKESALQALAKSVSELDLGREMKVLNKTIPFWTVGGDIGSIGTQTLAQWQQTVDTAKRVGLVESAPAAKDLFVSGLDK